MFNYEPETRTNIEELYNERIAAFNNAMNERIIGTKLELEFQKRQNEVIRKEKEYLESENFLDRKRTKSTYRRNQELIKENARLKQKNNLLENQ